MFHVIDCTKASGFTYRTRFQVVAVTVARWATMLTGRFHDVDTGDSTLNPPCGSHWAGDATA